MDENLNFKLKYETLREDFDKRMEEQILMTE